MNICFVTQQFPQETGWGGIGTYVYEMAKALAKCGHHVVVIARSTDRDKIEHNQGIVIYRITPRLFFAKNRFVWRMNRLWDGYALAVAGILDQVCKSHKIDLIEAPEAGAETFYWQLFPARKKVPLIVRLHAGVKITGSFPENLQPKYKKIKIFKENYAIKHAHAVSAPSQAIVTRYAAKHK